MIEWNEMVSGGGIMQSSFAIQNAGMAGVSSSKTAAQKAGGTQFSGALKKAVQSGKSSDSLDDIFAEASSRYHVPENLLKAVAKAESGFRANAVSSCGAQGVMQLMPGTAKSLGVDDPFDAEQNIMGGAKYLGGLLNQYGDEKLALAAYNAGSGNVKKYGGIPPFPETQNYVRKVLGYAGEDVSLPTGDISSVSSASETSGTILPGDSTDFSFDNYRLFLQIFLKALEQESAKNLLEPSSEGVASADLIG